MCTEMPSKLCLGQRGKDSFKMKLYKSSPTGVTYYIVPFTLCAKNLRTVRQLEIQEKKILYLLKFIFRTLKFRNILFYLQNVKNDEQIASLEYIFFQRNIVINNYLYVCLKWGERTIKYLKENFLYLGYIFS